MSKDYRQIKCLGNSIDTNEFYLHPITLKIAKNVSTHKICPTGFYYKNGKLETHIRTNFDPNLSNKDIQSYMALPYLNLSIEYMLNIYNIEVSDTLSIDSLMNQIDKMIQTDKKFETINRIINIWISYNFKELKENNNILVSIYKKLSSKYFPEKKLNNDELTTIINNWFKSHNMDDFQLNLGEYIYKK
jgi:hypothetical protein